MKKKVIEVTYTIKTRIDPTGIGAHEVDDMLQCAVDRVSEDPMAYSCDDGAVSVTAEWVEVDE